MGISYTDARSRFLTAFYQQILPRVEAFDPELVVISAGFDGHKNDPLGSDLGLLEEDYESMTLGIARMCDKAGAACQGRIVSVLEGGYDVQAGSDALAKCVARHVKARAGTGRRSCRRRRRPSQNQSRRRFHNLTHHPHHLQSTSLFQGGRDH